MALTDNEREKTSKRSKTRAIDAKGNFRYSDKQKVEAVTSYLAVGNLALVSRLLGIPEITLRVWKASTWWKDLVEDLKMQEKLELSARMKKIIEASHAVVLNRLEVGDPVMNQKTGKIEYKPVSMKDAHTVGKDLIDRRAVIEKTTVDVAVTDDRADDKLERLAEKFAEMATKSIEKQINKRRTVDVEDVHAVDEERETRLQTGVRTLSGPSGADQTSLGTDSGETEVE